eukprot:gene1180-4394_t
MDNEDEPKCTRAEERYRNLNAAGNISRHHQHGIDDSSDVFEDDSILSRLLLNFSVGPQLSPQGDTTDPPSDLLSNVPVILPPYAHTTRLSSIPPCAVSKRSSNAFEATSPSLRRGELFEVDLNHGTVGRVGHAMISVKDDLYCVCGFQLQQHLSNSIIMKFNWKQRQWDPVVLKEGANKLKRTGASVVCYMNRYLICFGGFMLHWGAAHTNDLLIVDLEELRVHQIKSFQQPLPHPRDKHTAVIHNDHMYVFGGWGSQIQDDPSFACAGPEKEDDLRVRCGWTNTLFSLDLSPIKEWDGVTPLHLKWQKEDPSGMVPLPRAAHSAVVYKDSMVVFGGRTKPCRTNEFRCLDLTAMHWEAPWQMQGDHLPARSWHCATFVPPQYMFIQGGLDENRIVLCDTYIVDLETRYITQLPNHGFNTWHACAFVDPYVYYFGGSEESSPHDQIHHKLFRCNVFNPSLQDLCIGFLLNLEDEDFEDLKPYIPENLLITIQHRRATSIGPQSLEPANTEGT